MKKSVAYSSRPRLSLGARVRPTNNELSSTRSKPTRRWMTQSFISPVKYLFLNHSADTEMSTLNEQCRRDTALTHCGALGLLLLLFVLVPICRADEAPFTSATISGLGARNIGSATMSGRISAIAGKRESSGKITLFVGAASGGVWKSDDSGTRYRPVFDEQAVQSIGASAVGPKNTEN